MFFFHRPTTIVDLPDLIRGLIQRLAGARSEDKKHQKENKKRHASILKRRAEDCQPFDSLAESLGYARDKMPELAFSLKAKIE
jgi:hypothetical protein